MMDETPRGRRTRHRDERRQVLSAPAEDRRDQARELLEEQRRERRAARVGGRSGRAPAMNVEERRAAIVEVAVPMLVEHGANVKTSEIAAAAGIAEGTLFRAFRDKQALFAACMRAIFESTTEVAQIERIDRSLPLADRLTAGVRAVSDYQNRLWSVMVAMRSAGVDPREHADGEQHGPPMAMIRISAAVAGLFDADDLRVSPDLAARLLLGSVFSNRLQTEGLGDSAVELPELVDMFLHGILRAPTEGE
ncbi:MAG TPA: TetR/AcrR family transcriptional regulator [Pseudonocardiaceae bacterium]|nr:TetR/AcrR family transcriptional regulator [Pseudonocardiaceae bacterium]